LSNNKIKKKSNRKVMREINLWKKMPKKFLRRL